MMEVPTPPIGKTSTCPTLPSLSPDLTRFTRLDALGLVVVGQRIEADRAMLSHRVVADGRAVFTTVGPARRAPSRAR